ncbi:DUF4149 domain-containing protein [Sulfurimonas sp. HSL3-7]|uniref:DUF4149 domain-containing protein n=1 Tax=Sulfonitrofixus jiaomeiensis TaxID=3131938 RepID=UPI0031F73B89
MTAKQWTVTLYLLLIAMTLGAVLTLGIFVTATLFHSDSYLSGVMLDHYNEGILMAEIFRRFSYFIYFIAAVVFAFEGNEYKHGRRDNYAMVSGFVVIITALMFSGVYTPKILEMQALGAEATQSEAFEALHMGSEIDFKILAVALGVLFIRRMRLMFVQK